MEGIFSSTRRQRPRTSSSESSCPSVGHHILRLWLLSLGHLCRHGKEASIKCEYYYTLLWGVPIWQRTACRVLPCSCTPVAQGHCHALVKGLDCMCVRRETFRLIRRLHQFDVMRANKAPFAFGLEPRVPFLDKAFLDTSMTINPADKMVRAALFPSQLLRKLQSWLALLHLRSKLPPYVVPSSTS